MDSPEVSVIIPTLNEAENLPLLVPAIDEALVGRRYEVLIVDDSSRDGTDRVCAELAAKYPLRLLVRTQPKDGLSGAVLHGMASAGGRWLVVMDADLQHPPGRITSLLEPLEKAQADFALGSRYVQGGTTAEHWTLFRRLNSWVATLLSRPFAGRVRDPMSGFFAMARRTYEGAQRLTPLGYKIALELMCKCRVARVVEVPIHFDVRARGRSKLSLREQFRYLEHLSRLYDFTYPRASPAVKFLVVLAVSGLFATGLFLSLLGLGMGLVGAAVAAYPAAVLANAVFHLRYVRTQREFLIRPPWRDFWLISLAEWLAAGATAAWLAWRLDRPHPLEVFVLAVGAATVVRYVLRKELLQDLRGLRKEPRRDQ